MNLLIDTHVLLWWLGDDVRLGPMARNVIATRPTVFVSIASLWEIVIKRGIGKIDVDIATLFDALNAQGLATLPIEPGHLLALDRLARHHRDPFDRIIIAQALADDVEILTADDAFRQYDVELIDAAK